LELLLIAAGALAIFWLFNSDRSPLWRAIEARPRTLHAADLAAKFNGLLLFGLSGSYLSLEHCQSRQTIRFTKQEADTFTVEMPGVSLNETLQEGLARYAALAGVKLSIIAEYQFSVTSPDPAALESIVHATARLVGHDPTSLYRVAFEGPTDARVVNKYFGFS
jgi:hypothetical protein